jgi:hypothetical protein
LVTDLVETIVGVSCDAIRKQAPSITSDADRLKSITLEPEPANNGNVIDSTCWVDRRGVHRKGKGPVA